MRKLLHIAIKGLPREYNAFRSAIRTRSTKLSFDELSTMLSAEEEYQNDGLDVKDSVFAMAATTPKPNNSGYNQVFNRGNFNNRGGRGDKGPTNQSSQYQHFNQFQQVQPNVGPRAKVQDALQNNVVHSVLRLN
nr:hypothetical protein CFP56_56235 [Quercus suber]